LPFAGNYLFSETEQDFTLTASNPQSYIGYLNVTVDRVGYGEGCAVSSDIDPTTTSVILTLPRSRNPKGASVNVTCKKKTMNELKMKYILSSL
jgi:hypothetical protein